LIQAEVDGVSFFQFPNLLSFPELRHGVFTRNCGFSSGPFKSLNLSLSVGDEEEAIKLNRLLVSRCMDGGQLVFTKQMHDNDVVVVSGTNSFPFVGDALVCGLENRMLAIKIADCQAVLMYDPIRKVVANVHSGWRGSIKNVIGRTIEVMKERFGCSPSDIFGGISPSLGPCCAEFTNYRNEIPEQFWKYRHNENHFDFWRISINQLCDAGVMQENIYSSEICTKCNTNLFFSYRGEKITGRFVSVIGINRQA
jgi:polyphenol oxidase